MKSIINRCRFLLKEQDVTKDWQEQEISISSLGRCSPQLPRRFTIVSLIAVALMWSSACAREITAVEYLCCDWGPAMILPTKTNEVAQFNDAEDEIYFLKQVASSSRESAKIYLCKMKADGKGKTEIKELWHKPNYSMK